MRVGQNVMINQLFRALNLCFPGDPATRSRVLRRIIDIRTGQDT